MNVRLKYLDFLAIFGDINMKTIYAFKLAMIVLLINCASFANFTIDSQSVTINQTASMAEFEITFNRAPDFYTTTNSGNPVDSFQYYIIDDISPSFPGALNSDSVIRGDEIYLTDGIVIRDVFSFDGGQGGSGGFGPIKQIVDFQLLQNTLSFDVAFDVLGCPDGSFSYAIMLSEYGQMTDWAYVGDIHTVPAPSALILAGIGLAGLWLGKTKKH